MQASIDRNGRLVLLPSKSEPEDRHFFGSEALEPLNQNRKSSNVRWTGQVGERERKLNEANLRRVRR